MKKYTYILIASLILAPTAYAAYGSAVSWYQVSTSTPTNGYVLQNVGGTTGTDSWVNVRPTIVSTTTSTTLPITTTGSQQVIVWAKGQLSGNVNADIQLLSNGAVKDQINAITSTNVGFALMYTETPTSTQSITITTNAGSLSNTSIIAEIFN